MAVRLNAQSRWLRRLGVLALVLPFCPTLVASHDLENGRTLVDVDEIVVERNGTIAIFNNVGAPSRDVHLSSNFTLAPEVCLSGYSPHKYFRLWDMPHCIGRNGEPRPAVLVTHSNENCTGNALVHRSTGIGPNPGWWIEFPFPSPPFRPNPQRWSLIFHCHSEPFDNVADPFKRVYTTGGELQGPLKHQGPLALCEKTLPRLTDGSLQMVYEGCDRGQLDSWKMYDLPIDTCQSTREAKGLHLYRPGSCLDGSQARWARYWDNECEDLHDINEITDGDFARDTCQLLNYKNRQVGSVAFYCGGFDVGAVDEDVVVEVTRGKEIMLLEPTPKLQPSSHVPLPTPLPRKPWITPFWKGLFLVDSATTFSRDDRYLNPMFQELAIDSCYSTYNSPLQIFQVPRCFNLTRANVAFFTWSYCKGSPVLYDGTDEKLLDISFCMSTGNGYNSMAFWCEGTGPPWEKRQQNHYLPSYCLKGLLLIGGLFTLLTLVSKVWSISRIQENVKDVFGSSHGPIALTD
ncbi:hypothetical protein MMC11_005751 [Xylographa trunciseda]|nr:hypothetical protein [Xylographa trunciseda]